MNHDSTPVHPDDPDDLHQRHADLGDAIEAVQYVLGTAQAPPGAPVHLRVEEGLIGDVPVQVLVAVSTEALPGRDGAVFEPGSTCPLAVMVTAQMLDALGLQRRTGEVLAADLINSGQKIGPGDYDPDDSRVFGNTFYEIVDTVFDDPDEELRRMLDEGGAA